MTVGGGSDVTGACCVFCCLGSYGGRLGVCSGVVAAGSATAGACGVGGVWQAEEDGSAEAIAVAITDRNSSLFLRTRTSEVDPASRNRIWGLKLV